MAPHSDGSATAHHQARILFASDSSGHSMGYHVVARGLLDAGFEVIITGRQFPQEAAAAAAEEDADLIAFRTMDRDPVELIEALLNAMREEGIAHLPVLVGGIVGKRDAAALRTAGVVGVFGPGSKLADIVDCARAALAENKSGP